MEGGGVYGLTHAVPAMVGFAAKNEPKFWFALMFGFMEPPILFTEGCPVAAL